jgi:cellulose synthase/poly-beta-1,6-N-acetylglucosamine synthase-like glycosyltransferase
MFMHLLLSGLNLAILAIAILLFIPFLTLFVECISAFWAQKRKYKNFLTQPSTPPFKLAVLIPAHNEAPVIADTLRVLLPQLSTHDRLLVIADNCTDDTAAIARAAGATVVERRDSHLRGKGYAMDFGVRYLASNPPDVLVTVDADCITQPGAIAALAHQAFATGQPVQSTYLMVAPENPSLKDSVSALAVIVKNWVRPLGLSQLGFPCVLSGSGMAFPWSIICNAPLAHSKTVDDMQLTIDLALVGHMVTYCPTARIIGRLMENQAARSQRSRWEHGHLDVIQTQVPRLLSAAWQQRRLDLALLALDLSVLPLSLLGMVWAIVSGIAVVVWLMGGAVLPLVLLALQAVLLITSVLGAWATFDRCGMSLAQLLGIPLYVLWKIPLYIAFLIKPQTKWLKTERDAIAVDSP